MNRPSHWILAFLAIGGGSLWLTGGLEQVLEATRSQRVAREAEARKNIILPNPGTPVSEYAVLRGRVVDRLGWPVVAAEIRVTGSDRAPVLSDSDGRFRLELSGAVQRTLEIAAPGRHDPELVRGTLDEIQVVLQDPLPWTEPVALPAASGNLLAGEGFLKGEDGTAVTQARVFVRPSGAMAETDANGRFVVPLPDGPCSLIAWDVDGRVAVSEELRFARRQGKVPVPDLVMTPGAAARGRMVDAEGAPVAGMVLVADNLGARHVVRSATDGSFVVAGLAHGETTLTAVPDRGLLGFRATLEVQGDVSVGDVTVVRVPQEPLRIRVVDGEDTAQAFVHVVAEQADGLRRAYGTTDRDGIVVLAGLAEDEPTLFEVRNAGHTSLSILGFEPTRGSLIVSP